MHDHPSIEAGAQHQQEADDSIWPPGDPHARDEKGGIEITKHKQGVALRQSGQQTMYRVPNLMAGLCSSGTRVISIFCGTDLFLLPVEGPLIDDNTGSGKNRRLRRREGSLRQEVRQTSDERLGERAKGTEDRRESKEPEFDDLQYDHDALKEDLQYYKGYSQEADATLLEAKEKLRQQKKKIQSLKETMGVALSGSEGEAEEEEEVFQKVFNEGVEEEEEEKEESKEEKKEAARKPKPLETEEEEEKAPSHQAAKETTPT